MSPTSPPPKFFMSILRSKYFSETHKIPLYTNQTNSLSQTQKLPFTNPYYPFSNLSKIQNKYSKLNLDLANANAEDEALR